MARRDIPLTAVDGWQFMTMKDIPSALAMGEEIPPLMQQRYTNGDKMREQCRIRRKLKKGPYTSRWNETPDGIFVNEFAFVLKVLGEHGIVATPDDVEYQLLSDWEERWPAAAKELGERRPRHLSK